MSREARSESYIGDCAGLWIYRKRKSSQKDHSAFVLGRGSESSDSDRCVRLAVCPDRETAAAESKTDAGCLAVLLIENLDVIMQDQTLPVYTGGHLVSIE